MNEWKLIIMMHPLPILPDETEIVYSHLHTLDEEEQVRLTLAPIYLGFKCHLLFA